MSNTTNGSFENQMIDLLNDVTDGQMGTTYVIEAARKAAALHNRECAEQERLAVENYVVHLGTMLDKDGWIENEIELELASLSDKADSDE